MRGRNRNNNSKGPNPLTRSYESNGPDVKIRGTAQHIAEKYSQLARDAQASGDPVAAENYFQHAEHYFRIIAAAQEQLREQYGYQQRSFEEDGEEEGGFQGERPFAAGEGKWQISPGGGFEPRWSSDGRELFYRDGAGNLWRVEVEPGEAFVAGARERLFAGMRTGDNPNTYSIEPGGARFLTLSLTFEHAVDRLGLILGWDREVARILESRR